MIGAVGLHAGFQDTVQLQRWVKAFKYAPSNVALLQVFRGDL